MKAPKSLPLESVLRSPLWRSLVVLGIVVALSFAMSVPRAEMAELRGRPVDRTELFLREMVRWGAWAMAAWPIGALARWIMLRSGSWLLLLALQIPLAAGASYGYLQLDYALSPVLWGAAGDQQTPRLETPRGLQGRARRGANEDERGGFRGRNGRRGFGGRPDGEGPSMGSPFWRFRWMQTMVVYWVVLMMGAGVRSFLELRDKERKTADLELRAEKLRVQLASAQLATLKGQLNPHFLFNALHTVGGLIRAQEQQTALKTLAAIGELLRATLDHGDAEEVSLGAELHIAQRYLDIERIRLGERLQLELDIEAGIEGALVPALVLLPLVENSVRHGISPRPEGGRILLHASRDGSSLKIEVSDNGEGFPHDVLKSGSADPERERRSIGLENTRGRLLALYGEQQEFELGQAEPHGASVRIVLPFHREPIREGPRA